MIRVRISTTKEGRGQEGKDPPDDVTMRGDNGYTLITQQRRHQANATSTVYCGGPLTGEDVQKHLGLTRMSSGCRPAVTVRGSDLDAVELQMEHERSDLLTAAVLQTVTCCWAEYWFYSNAGNVKGFSFWA